MAKLGIKLSNEQCPIKYLHTNRVRCYAIGTRPSANVRVWYRTWPDRNNGIALHRVVLRSTRPYESGLIWLQIAARDETPNSWYGVPPGGDTSNALCRTVLCSTCPYNSTLIWLQIAARDQTPNSWYGVQPGGDAGNALRRTVLRSTCKYNSSLI